MYTYFCFLAGVSFGEGEAAARVGCLLGLMYVEVTGMKTEGMKVTNSWCRQAKSCSVDVMPENTYLLVIHRSPSISKAKNPRSTLAKEVIPGPSSRYGAQTRPRSPVEQHTEG